MLHRIFNAKFRRSSNVDNMLRNQLQLLTTIYKHLSKHSIAIWAYIHIIGEY